LVYKKLQLLRLLVGRNNNGVRNREYLFYDHGVS
jgi:hypothetical protein